jgi:hypothetical protein
VIVRQGWTVRPGRGIGAALGFLVVYAGVVVWITWPLASEPATRVPRPSPFGIFDLLHNVWALAWETHSLTTKISHLADANIYHPAPMALFYGPTAFGALPLFAPVYLATGSSILAINVTFLLGVALTIWGTHLVAARWTGSHVVGAVAGVALAGSPVLWWNTASAPYLTMLAAMPWIIALVAAGAPGGLAVAGLGMLIALQGSIDPMSYMLASAGPTAVVVALDARRRETRSRALRIALGLAVGIALLSPVYAGYVAVARANPGLQSQSRWPTSGGDTSLTFAQSLWSTIAGLWSLATRLPLTTLIPVDAWPRLGLFLAGASLVRHLGPSAKRGAIVALVWTLVGLSSVVLGLPPIKGAIIPWCPPVRTIARLSSAAVVSIPLLIALAVEAIARAVGQRWSERARVVVGVVALGLLVLQLAAVRPSPYPTVNVGGPPESLLPALRSGDGPLLELPATKDLSLLTAAMYRSTFHWRPLVNGYSSFWPARYPEYMELAAKLPDRDALVRLSHETNLDLVLVHLRGLPLTARPRWLDVAAVKATGLDLVARTPSELLFRVAAEVR